MQTQALPNFLPFNWFLLIETLTLYYFFHSIVSSSFAKYLIYIFSAGFLAIWINVYLKIGTGAFLDVCVALQNITIILLCIIYFYEQLKTPETLTIYNYPRFWVVTAYLLYSAGTFFLFLYIDSLHIGDQQRYYVLNYTFLFLKAILLSIAMFMKNNPPARKKFQLT